MIPNGNKISVYKCKTKMERKMKIKKILINTFILFFTSASIAATFDTPERILSQEAGNKIYSQDFIDTISEISDLFINEYSNTLGKSLMLLSMPNPGVITDQLKIDGKFRYYKEALLYIKFSLEEQIRWTKWNLDRSLIGFSENAAVFLIKSANLDTISSEALFQETRGSLADPMGTQFLQSNRALSTNPELINLKLAVINSIIKSKYGFKFLLEINTSSQKNLSKVKKFILDKFSRQRKAPIAKLLKNMSYKEANLKDLPLYGYENVVASALVDLVMK